MKSILVAAWMARMAATGGAGPDVEQQALYVQAGGTWEDVRKDFSALRSEFSTLEAEFQAAREQRRLEALRRKEESDRMRRAQ